MIYFDNAATTFPKPPQVIREMTTCMKEYCGNPGRGSHPMALAAAEAVYDARCRVADFFGLTKPENVIFTKNTTEALNLVLSGIAREGGHFLISNLEHNSVWRTVHHLCETRGMRYDIFDALCEDSALLSELDRKILPQTVAVVTTHASNICPRILPIGQIGELCRRRQVPLILDAAQSAGIYDIGMERDAISVLCAPGHKGLYGPQGSGFAAFAEPFDFERFSPFLIGGNGKNSYEPEMGHEPPESYEAGTVATPNLVGLAAGIRFVDTYGRERIKAHETALFRYASALLREKAGVKLFLPSAMCGSLLLLGFEKHSPTAVAEALGAEEICVRAGLHCAPLAHRALNTGADALRISFSVWNTTSEVARFVEVLDWILRK